MVEVVGYGDEVGNDLRRPRRQVVVRLEAVGRARPYDTRRQAATSLRTSSNLGARAGRPPQPRPAPVSAWDLDHRAGIFTCCESADF